MLKSKLVNIEMLEELSERDTLKYDETNILTLISAKILSVNKKNDILTLSFYNKKNRKLEYRLFLDKKQRDYITQDFSEKSMKWKTGTLEHIISYYWDERSIILNDSSMKSILKYFNIKEKPLAAISAFQQSVIAERLLVKHKIITDRIDYKMKLVPKLPKGFNRWIDEDALYNSRYIYYKYKSSSNKPMEGYCTHCHNDVLVNKPKHNEQGICPICKSTITYKAIGKSTKIEDTVQVGIIQKISTGIIVRYFKVFKAYWDHYRTPKLYINECGRDFYENDEISIYAFAEFKQTGMQRWCEGEGHLNNGMFIRYNYNDIRLYTRNLDNSLINTKYQYCQIKQYAATKKINIYKYLYYYSKYPFIEYLIKLNLTNLVDGILGRDYINRYEDLNKIFNFKCKKLHDILKINKCYIPLLQKLNISLNGLRIVQQAYKSSIKITEELIRYVEIKLNSNTDIFDLSVKYKLTINKILKYINFQSKGNKNNESFLFTTWRDYINNCDILNKLCVKKTNNELQENTNQNLFDLTSKFVLFPKDLEKKHDETTNLLQDVNVEQYNEIIHSMYETISKAYSFSSKDFIIVVPKNAQDITHEGQKLEHCVGSYVQNVATQKTNILFLREKKNPSKPFYTMEVKDGKVIQCRGRNNHSMTPEVENFLNQFKIKKLGYAKSA